MKISKKKLISVITGSLCLLTISSTSFADAGYFSDNSGRTFYYGNYNYSTGYSINGYTAPSNTITNTYKQNTTASTSTHTTKPNDTTQTNYAQNSTSNYINNNISYGNNDYSIGYVINPYNNYSVPSNTNSNSSPSYTTPTNTNTSNSNQEVSDNKTSYSTDYNITANEKLLLSKINEDRQKEGLKPLALDQELFRIAEIKSRDMYENGYFSHTSPTFGSTFSLMRKEGVNYSAAAENIGKTSSVERAHQGFMNSEGHRKNIMSSTYTHVGIGIVGNRYTEVFIRK